MERICGRRGASSVSQIVLRCVMRGNAYAIFGLGTGGMGGVGRCMLVSRCRSEEEEKLRAAEVNVLRASILLPPLELYLQTVVSCPIECEWERRG